MRIDDSLKTNHQDDDVEATRTPAAPPNREKRIADGLERYELGSAIDAHADEAARMLAQNAGVTAPTATPSFNDKVLYVGMNSANGQWRSEALQFTGPQGIVVQHSELAPTADKPAIGADRIDIGEPKSPNVVDLSTKAGASAFAATLGLPAVQAEKVASVVLNASTGSRDELAQIAQVWAKAENDAQIPSRLVLSGHSAGTAIYDGDNHLGFLGFDSVKQLADALPKAAAQIEDVMISACNSGFDAGEGGRARLSDWARHFPNLKTAWGYANESHSPTGQQAVFHIMGWEAATRGRTTEVHGKQAVDAAFDRGEQEAQKHIDPKTNLPGHVDSPQLDGNVSTWTSTRGYIEGKD